MELTKEEMLEDLSEEYAMNAYSEPIRFDDERGEYYQMIEGEEEMERFTIDPKFYPIIDRYI